MTDGYGLNQRYARGEIEREEYRRQRRGFDAATGRARAHVISSEARNLRIPEIPHRLYGGSE